MAGAHQCGFAQGGGQVRTYLVQHAIPVPGKAIWIALFLLGVTGAAAQDPRAVHYTCEDGTKLQATFSPPSTAMGSVKLVYAGSSTETMLPQAVSADGGRYTQGDVEFWVKGKGATLTRAGQSTSCRISS